MPNNCRGACPLLKALSSTKEFQTELFKITETQVWLKCLDLKELFCASRTADSDQDKSDIEQTDAEAVPVHKLESKDKEDDQEASSSKDQGCKTPTERHSGSQNDDSSAQGEDQANAGAGAQPKKRLLYHVHDNSKKRNVLAKIVTLRKDNPQDKFIMKSIEDNKITQARTIWFKGGYCPRGKGGKRVPNDYSEERVDEPENSDSELVRSESDPAKSKAGYKTPSERRRGSQNADTSAQEEVQAYAGAKAQAKKSDGLLYHVHDNSKKRNVLAKIVTLRKDNPQDKFIMKSIEDNKIIQARTIWFKGGYCPRGKGGKRVPNDYSEERVAEPETSESGLVHSESDPAKFKAGTEILPKKRSSSQDKDESTQEDGEAKVGADVQPKKSNEVTLQMPESKNTEDDQEDCSSKDQEGYETPTKKRRGSKDKDDSAEEDD
ncbi:claspin-like [Ptychodera flava]|uniref:claspin-like n=1 Tax=Ptychodera flava TaxID=63121 RepID=UPI00396A4E4A